MTGTLLDIEEVRYGLLSAYINIMVALQIREMRVARGWTQEELGKRAGLHASQVCDLESIRWKHDPTVSTLRKISEAFDVALSIKFTGWSSLFQEFCGSSEIDIPVEFCADPVFARSGSPVGESSGNAGNQPETQLSGDSAKAEG